ncbi:MAG: hypothetical protein WCO35_02710 [Candidatus Nomurabacteria bacterium]
MKTFLKIFAGFWVIWLVWYFTGGPQRTENIKPYVKYDYDTGSINSSNIDLQTGAQEILPINTGKQIDATTQDSLNKKSFSNSPDTNTIKVQN